jgi:GTP-binding protein HflX
MKGGARDVARPIERAVLVGIDNSNGRHDATTIGAEESLRELERLARTAGVEPVATLHQNVRQISPATYIGKGKVEELKETVKAKARPSC